MCRQGMKNVGFKHFLTTHPLKVLPSRNWPVSTTKFLDKFEQINLSPQKCESPGHSACDKTQSVAMKIEPPWFLLPLILPLQGINIAKFSKLPGGQDN